MDLITQVGCTLVFISGLLAGFAFGSIYMARKFNAMTRKNLEELYTCLHDLDEGGNCDDSGRETGRDIP